MVYVVELSFFDNLFMCGVYCSLVFRVIFKKIVEFIGFNFLFLISMLVFICLIFGVVNLMYLVFDLLSNKLLVLN